MISIKKIEDSNGSYFVFDQEDFEFKNSMDHMEDIFKTSRTTIMKEFFRLKNLNINPTYIENFIKKEVGSEWENERISIENVSETRNLISLLHSSSKSEQVKLLNGFIVSTSELRAFFATVTPRFNFTLSQYKCNHYPKGLNSADLPTLVEVTKEGVNKIGNTTLSEPQLKQVIEHRKVTIAKFLDKADTWHCFFITYKSLRGEEPWGKGQPHYHYISDKFGLTRQEVINQLKSRNYKLGSLPHIGLKVIN